MRHRKSRLRLRHKPAYARAMLRNILTSVLLYESIRTTKKRAEVAQPLIEKIITISKTKDPRNAIRAISQHVMDVNANKKVMEVLKDRYKNRTSGYTRIVPLGLRQGDGAKLVTLELVDANLASAEDTDAEKISTKTKNSKSSKKTVAV